MSEVVETTETKSNDFHSQYMESVQAGDTMPQFAARVGLKVGSAIARVSSIRGELRKKGATEEEVNKLFPSLTRVAGSGRAKSKSDFIDALLAKVR
jgi:hypothetical protein